MDYSLLLAAFSLLGLLIFSELAAACFRRLSPFLQAWSKYTQPDAPEARGWEKLALLSWAFASTIPLLSFCLTCIFFMDQRLETTKSFIVGATLGSNIIALGLFFGLILFSSQLSFFRIRTMTSPVFLFLSTTIFTFTCLDGKITLFEGILLWVLAVAYALYFRSFSSEWKYYQRNSNDAATEIASSLLSIVSILCMGFGFFLCAILVAYPFAHWMADFTARGHYSSLVLGAHAIAALLTLPWLIHILFTIRSTDTQKAMRITGITHTCLLNILFLPGVLVWFAPLQIIPEVLQVDLPVLLFFTGTYVSTLLIEKQEGRALPSFIILSYIIYVATGVFR